MNELCEDFQEKIECGIKKFIERFEQLIIKPLLELYALKISGIESYIADEDNCCYYEWHLDNNNKISDLSNFKPLS